MNLARLETLCCNGATARGARSAIGRGRYGMAACILVAALAGCTEIRYEAGTPPGAGPQTGTVRASKRPDMNVLEGTLKLGVSTKPEVAAALGRPTGDGGIFLPMDQKPRETWSYYYEEGSVRAQRGTMTAESRRTFLFVYFEGDRYDGYMWFSSLP